MGRRSGQTWQPEGYRKNAGFVADLGLPAVDLLAPQAGERVLDLGCGDGRLTSEIATRGAEVVGVDGSPELLAVARSRGLTVVEGDGHQLPFAGEFNAVFSNAALHWMIRPKEVIEGVRRALKPGGRFVGEFGGHGNVAAIVTAVLAVLWHRGIDGKARFPWFFPTPDEYAGLLVQGGFRVLGMELFPRPTPLPTDMAGWLDTFAGSFFHDFTLADRSVAINEVLALLAPSLKDEAGRWTADYVRLRFAAQKV